MLDEQNENELMRRNVYTSNRIFNARARQLINTIMTSRSSGIEARVHYTIKEFGDLSGWVHCHGVAWQKNSLTKSAILKAQEGEEPLSSSDKTTITDYAESILSVSISPYNLSKKFGSLNGQRAESISRLADELQEHFCTWKCAFEKGKEGCRHYFPRLPSEYTLIAATTLRTPDPVEEEIRNYFLGECAKIKEAVASEIKKTSRAALRTTTLLQLLLKALGDVDNSLPTEGCYRWKGGIFPSPVFHVEYRHWIEKISSEHPHGDEHKYLFSIYYTALSTATRRKDQKEINELVMERDVKEAYVATYNPYLLEAMKSNMEVTLVLHTPDSVLHYITKSSKPPKSQSETSRKLNDGSVSQATKNRIEAMREVSEAEAFFRLDPELTLRETNMPVEWINTALPNKRTGSFIKAEDEDGISLPGKTGQYVKTLSFIDKYERR